MVESNKNTVGKLQNDPWMQDKLKFHSYIMIYCFGIFKAIYLTYKKIVDIICYVSLHSLKIKLGNYLETQI